MQCQTKACAGGLVVLLQSSHQGRTVLRCPNCNALYSQVGHELHGEALDNRPRHEQEKDKKGKR